MKERIKIQVYIPAGWKKWLRLGLRAVIGLAILAGLVFSAYMADQAVKKYELVPLARDLVIAVYAHRQAGPPILFDSTSPNYTDSFPIDPGATFGQMTNSLWMARMNRLIIPYFEYDHLTARATYPAEFVFLPLPSADSFHVGGRAFLWYNSLLLNERYVLADSWNDQREILSTFVHELIHMQGGVFIDGDPEAFESATSAATLEVLAAMCNDGEELGCLAFWREVENFARGSAAARAAKNGWNDNYQRFADRMFRDEADERSARRAARFWAGEEDTLRELREKYSQGPWEDRVIPGVVAGQAMNTHSVDWSEGNGPKTGSGVVIAMPFDDARDLLSGLLWLLAMK